MTTDIRVAGIVKESIVDGPGIRYVLFVQGCRHNCTGCHNPETHSFDGGNLIKISAILDQIKKNPLLDGVTFSGGEPFEQAGVLSELALEVRKLDLNVMTYTGYTYEYLEETTAKRPDFGKLLDVTDILVDGRFELGKRNLLLKFKGSENQRIIDVKRSKAENRVIMADI